MDGVYEAKVESQSVIEILSKFSTEELVEALRLKEDVQANDTTEETCAVKYDLTKVKKYCLLINNCDVELVQRNLRLQEAQRYLHAGGCCD